MPSVKGGLGPNRAVEFAQPSPIVRDGFNNPTADLAATEAQDVAALNARRGSVGTLSVTEAQDTASVIAVRGSRGTLAVTDGQDQASINALWEIGATLAAIEGQDSADLAADLIVAPVPVIIVRGGDDAPKKRKRRKSSQEELNALLDRITAQSSVERAIVASPTPTRTASHDSIGDPEEDDEEVLLALA